MVLIKVIVLITNNNYNIMWYMADCFALANTSCKSHNACRASHVEILRRKLLFSIRGLARICTNRAIESPTCPYHLLFQVHNNIINIIPPAPSRAPMHHTFSTVKNAGTVHMHEYYRVV